MFSQIQYLPPGTTPLFEDKKHVRRNKKKAISRPTKRAEFSAKTSSSTSKFSSSRSSAKNCSSCGNRKSKCGCNRFVYVNDGWDVCEYSFGSVVYGDTANGATPAADLVYTLTAGSDNQVILGVNPAAIIPGPPPRAATLADVQAIFGFDTPNRTPCEGDFVLITGLLAPNAGFNTYYAISYLPSPENMTYGLRMLDFLNGNVDDRNKYEAITVGSAIVIQNGPSGAIYNVTSIDGSNCTLTVVSKGLRNIGLYRLVHASPCPDDEEYCSDSSSSSSSCSSSSFSDSEDC